MNVINRLTNSIFDVLLTPFEFLGPEMALILVSGLFGIIALVLFKHISWQKGIKATKDKIKGHMIEIRLYQDDLVIVARAIGKVLLRNLQYLALNFGPILPLFIPFVFVLAQFVVRYAFDPVPVTPDHAVVLAGQGTLITVELDEAHRQDIPVWSHLYIGPAGPLDVVEAGVDVVSHASQLALALGREGARSLLATDPDSALDLSAPAIDSVLAAMVRLGTIYDPTLFIYQDRPATLRVAAGLVARAHDAGVRISAGTDSLAGADGVSLPNLHREMQLLVELAGLSPAEALDAATRTAAAATNVLDSRGTVEVGKLADLVVLGADPTGDINNTKQVELVVKRGRLYALATRRLNPSSGVAP